MRKYLITLLLLAAFLSAAFPAVAQDDPLANGIKLLKGDCKAAIIEFTRVIGLQPRLANAYAYRGIAETNCKRYPQALDDVKIALKLDPQNARAYLVRGAVEATTSNLPQ